MTSYGFCFRSTSGNSSGTLHLWVTCRGMTRFVPTRYDVRHHEWDNNAECLIFFDDRTGRCRKLAEYEKSMERDLRLMGTIVRRLENGEGKFNAYRSAISGNKMLGIYAAFQANELMNLKQERVAATYLTAARRFIGFNRGCDVDMENITTDMMNDFQQMLKADGVSLNTISFYMRTLRAIYNKAVAEGLVPQRLENPFDEVYTYVPVQNYPGRKTGGVKAETVRQEAEAVK